MTAIPLETSWSLGTLIWLPSFVVLLIAFAVGSYLLFRLGKNDTYDAVPPYVGAAVCGLVALCLIVGTALGMYPYKAEYHQWRDVSGTVAQIDKRLLGSGSGMSDKFVLRLAEDGAQYACDDTRCAQIRQGDSATLSCKRAWQYTGTDGYDCRFVSSERAS